MTTRLLDADVCITILRRKNPAVGERFKQALLTGEPMLLSSVTTMELWYGVWRSARPDVQGQRLQSFLDAGPPIISFNGDDAQACAELRAELAARGKPIGQYDALLAGQARRRNLTVVTGNVREFSRIPGLAVEDWSQSE